MPGVEMGHDLRGGAANVALEGLTGRGARGLEPHMDVFVALALELSHQQGPAAQ
jgi:hypothetical protein